MMKEGEELDENFKSCIHLFLILETILRTGMAMGAYTQHRPAYAEIRAERERDTISPGLGLLWQMRGTLALRLARSTSWPGARNE